MSHTAPARRTSWGPTLAIIGGLAVVAVALLVVPPFLAPGEQTPRPEPSPSVGVASSVPISPFRAVNWAIVPVADPAATLDALVIHNGRLIAAERTSGSLAFRYSDDGGQQWRQAAVGGRSPPREDARGRLSHIVANRSGLIATGTWSDADDNALGALLLLSADGRHWEILPVQPELAGSRFISLVAVDDGYLGYAVDVATSAQGWWQSADGLTWTPAPVSGLPTTAPPPHMAASQDAVVAVSERLSADTRLPAAWISEDGLAWTATIGAVPFGSMSSVAYGTAGFAAGGRTWTDADGEGNGLATVWRSADGTDWTHVTIGGGRGTAVAQLATGSAGTIAILSGTNEGETTVAFVPNGSDEATSVSLPLTAFAPLAVDDGFVMLGRCADDAGCGAATYLLFGLPIEDADAPTPTIPPG